MLLITKTFDSKGDMIYGYNEMHNLSVETWRKDIGDELPWDVVIAIDSGHHLYERLTSLIPYVEPIIDEAGELVGVHELDIPERVPDPRDEIVGLMNNLKESDHFIIKRLEALLPSIYSMLGVHDVDSDTELQNTIEDRKLWRARINQIENDLMGRS